MRVPQLGPAIENRGEALRAFISGLKDSPSVARRYLEKFGIIKGDAEIDPRAWYPIDACLSLYHSVAGEVGPHTSYSIGRKISENAVFPPHVNDIHSAIRAIDVAYHLNHRKDGVTIFDPATGVMLEGIGHYHYDAVEGERRIRCICENPYPCDFDLGIGR